MPFSESTQKCDEKIYLLRLTERELTISERRYVFGVPLRHRIYVSCIECLNDLLMLFSRAIPRLLMIFVEDFDLRVVRLQLFLLSHTAFDSMPMLLFPVLFC